MNLKNASLRLLAILLIMNVVVSCKKTEEDSLLSGAEQSIADKYKALGWDTQTTTAIGKPEKTKGGNGYVQYYKYGSRIRAIYNYSNGTFGLEPDLMDKYDALGQETFNSGALGKPTSDSKSCGSGCIYSDFEKGILLKSNLTTQAVAVYGDIYTKYVSFNRWSGILGWPKTDELDLTSKRGRYNGFVGGQIFWSAATGAQVIWDKVEFMYKNTGYDTGWLGLPISSVSPNAPFPRVASFEGGSIVIESICGIYYNKSNQQVLVNGTTRSTTCY